MEIIQLLTKIYNYNKYAFLLGIFFFLSWSTGLLLFWITRPVVALSHLLMGNFHTAKEKITEYIPLLNLGDALKNRL